MATTIVSELIQMLKLANGIALITKNKKKLKKTQGCFEEYDLKITWQ